MLIRKNYTDMFNSFFSCYIPGHLGSGGFVVSQSFICSLFMAVLPIFPRNGLVVFSDFVHAFKGS